MLTVGIGKLSMKTLKCKSSSCFTTEIMCMGMTFSPYHDQMKGPFEVELTALCDTQTLFNSSIDLDL